MRAQLGFQYGGVTYDLGGATIGLRAVAEDRIDEDHAPVWTTSPSESGTSPS